MASLDTLTPDQRAVLDLVLRRGRSYDDIARLLAIDRAAVRARALAAFDAIGPETGITAESRALITDYLLGQLPERVAEQTRERLTHSPYDSAWARVVASELEQVADKPLPEIPDATRGRTPAPEASSGTARAAESGRAQERQSGSRPPRRRPARLSDRPSSRRGGAIMLGVGVIVVAAVAVGLAALLNGGSKKNSVPRRVRLIHLGPDVDRGQHDRRHDDCGHRDRNLHQPGADRRAGQPEPTERRQRQGSRTRGQGRQRLRTDHRGPERGSERSQRLRRLAVQLAHRQPAPRLREPRRGQDGQAPGWNRAARQGQPLQAADPDARDAERPKTPGTIVLQGPLTGLPAAS